MICTILRNHRNTDGYSQQELSRYLGLRSRNAYSLKERGERRFSMDEGIRLAHLFETSVEQLFAERAVKPSARQTGQADLREV